MADIPLVLLGLAILGVAGWVVVQKVREDGAREALAALEKARVEAIHDKKEKDDEVNDLAPADLDKRFDRWMR